MSFTLNTLKLFGIVLGGCATVMATLKETKTPDKLSLTREGRVILSLGVLGFIVAVSAQGADWYLSNLRDKSAANKNQRLLLEIRRAVTRLTDISVDTDFSVNSSQPEVKTYAEHLQNRLAELDSDDEPVGTDSHGLRVLSRTYGPFPHNSVIKIPTGSDALPGQDGNENAKLLMDLTQPTITIYKSPDPLNLEAISAEQIHPDLTLRARGGTLEGFIVPPGDTEIGLNNPLVITFRRRGILIAPETWDPASGLESMQDLKGAQIVVSISRNSPAQRLWAIQAPTITLFINHHRILLHSLTAVRTKAGDWTAYVCPFPSDVLPEPDLVIANQRF